MKSAKFQILFFFVLLHVPKFVWVKTFGSAEYIKAPVEGQCRKFRSNEHGTELYSSNQFLTNNLSSNHHGSKSIELKSPRLKQFELKSPWLKPVELKSPRLKTS